MVHHRSKLSVIIPAGNRKDVIDDCLKSVRWADEVIVVDSFSTDGTLEIAKKYADRILQNEYGFSARQKNWAIPQAAHEWVLLVDTDERVTDALKAEILKILEIQPLCAGYRIPRVNYVFGQKVAHAGYYPDYQVRLFRRDQARYQLRKVHAHVILDGPCGEIHAPLVHYAHRSLAQTVPNLLLQMTTWEADERLEQRPVAAKFLWFHILFRPLMAFFLRYFVQGGWRDGVHGLAVSLLWASYVNITYLKMWEKSLELSENWWLVHWQDERVRRDGG